jgi:hypothetical protein
MNKAEALPEMTTIETIKNLLSSNSQLKISLTMDSIDSLTESDAEQLLSDIREILEI